MSIKTTHVGSLPRTQEVVDMIFARWLRCHGWASG